MSVTELADYPWDAVRPFAERARAHPGGMVDLSIGSPVDPTPDVIAEALARATDAHSYPQTSGSAELRAAIASWYQRRRGVPDLTPAHTLPTVGSKELVALLPLLLGLGPGDAVVHPEVAYPSYRVGAQVVGATPVATDDPDAWPAQTRLVWLNSPGNPDGRVLDAGQLRAARAGARERGAVLVSDECYAELGWEAPWDRDRIPCILEPSVTGGDLSGVLSAYSLSKQSNLAGFRAAFVAGDPALIERLLTARKHLGLMMPQPVQRAMVTALGDDEHVRVQRERYRERRELLRPALEHAGFRIDHSEAGLYLWVTRGEDAWASVREFAERGILVGPGTFYAEGLSQHVRLSLTASTARIRDAAHRLGAA